MDLAESAVARFAQGYSCSQAVFSVLAEQWNIGPDVSLRVAAGFGGGLARCAGTCGAVTGAIMALGLAQRDISPEGNRSAKEQTYEASRAFMRAFAERNGSVVCRELLGCDISTHEGHEEARRRGLFKSQCPKLVRDAVEIAEPMIAG